MEKVISPYTHNNNNNNGIISNNNNLANNIKSPSIIS